MAPAVGTGPENFGGQRVYANLDILGKSGYYSLLFINDVELSREALHVLRVKEEIDINQAAHWAMNLGCDKLAESLYRTMLHCEGQGSIRVNGLRFRRERIEGRTNNSYQAVLNLSNKERISIIEKAVHSCIEFNGGIGTI